MGNRTAKRWEHYLIHGTNTDEFIYTATTVCNFYLVNTVYLLYRAQQTCALTYNEYVKKNNLVFSTIVQKNKGGMYAPYTDTPLTMYVGDKSSYISCVRNSLQEWQYKREYRKLLK